MKIRGNYIYLRSKEDADDFLDYEIQDGGGEIDFEPLRLPKKLGGKKVKIVFSQGKKEKRRILVQDETSGDFFNIHPSSVDYTSYD